MKHKLIIILVGLLYTINIFSQSLIDNIFENVASPTVQDLGKYGEIPMSLYTGRANVSIPLYSTTQRNVPLNICLSYDTGGLLINQLPSWTGHGWTLNAGGCITRKLQGYYDEDENKVAKVARSQKKEKFVNYFHNHKTIENQTIEAVASDVTTGTTRYDYSPDIFVFNFMGKTGRFFFGPDKKWHVQCDENIKVVFDVNDQTNYILPFIPTYPNRGDGAIMSKTIKGFTLIDENGIKYKFGGTTDAIEYSIDFLDQDVEDWRANSWYLTEVEDRLGNILYKFTYKRGKFLAQIFNNYCAVFYDRLFSNYDKDKLIDWAISTFVFGVTYPFEFKSFHAKCAETTYDFPFAITLNAPVYLTQISTLDKTSIDFKLSESINIPVKDFYPSFDKYCSADLYTESGTPYNNQAKVPYVLNMANYHNVNNAEYLCYLRNHIGYAENYSQYWDETVANMVKKELAGNMSLPTGGKGFDNPLVVLSFNPLQNIEVSCKDQNNKKQRIKLIDIVYNKTPRLHITSVNIYGRDGNSTNRDVYSYKMEYNDYDKIPADYLTLENDFWGFYNGDANKNEANPTTTKYGMMRRLTYPTGGYTEFEYQQNTYNGYQDVIFQCVVPLDKDQYTGGLRIRSMKDYSKNNELFKKRVFDYGYGQCYEIPNSTRKEVLYGDEYSEQATYFYKKSSGIPLTDSYNSHIGYSWVRETNGTTSKEYNYTNFNEYLDEFPYLTAKKNTPGRRYSQYIKYSDKGFARGKLLGEYVKEDGQIKYECLYDYKYDYDRYIPSTTASHKYNNTFTVGGNYRLYYCNLEPYKKTEKYYDSDITPIFTDVTEYNMEDWRPNQKDLSFSLRKLKSEKITRMADGKEVDSQEKMYLYLTSELKDYFFPITDILTYRNGEQTMCHSVIYNTFSNVPNHKLPAKEIVKQYPNFQKHTKVSYEQYDKTGLLLQFTETGKPTTFLSWDNYGRLIKTAYGSPDSYITSYNYTPDGQINKITSPNGNATNYKYDSFGRLNIVTDVNDKTLQKFEYNYRKK